MERDIRVVCLQPEISVRFTKFQAASRLIFGSSTFDMKPNMAGMESSPSLYTQIKVEIQKTIPRALIGLGRDKMQMRKSNIMASPVKTGLV